MDQVTLKGPDGIEFVEKVVYETRPLQCYKCLKFGHSVRHCNYAPQIAWVATGVVLPNRSIPIVGVQLMLVLLW